MTCTYLGCKRRATHRMHPQYCRTFPVCAKHGPSWLETIAKFDNRQSAGSRLVKL